MSLARLGAEIAFPDPMTAEPDGLLAVGGDLRPERLLAAYACGVFPWYERPPILWFSPDPRMLLRPAELHVARRLRRTLRQGHFAFSLDADFGGVISACATLHGARGRGTWITPEMAMAYRRLHELGFAHSAEAWWDGRLVGGVYGVSLGAAFFAESMFHARRDASKAALTALVWQLAQWDFELVDCQLYTPHLERLGARPWPRARFLRALARALRRPTRRGCWRLAPGLIETRLRAQAAAQP